jgi:DNA-binding Lrp family transcriptional regulator
MPTLERSARQQLERVAARRRLDDRDINRAIDRAVRDGYSQREISDIIGNLSQATVQRIIRRLAASPELLRETPAEIIDRRAAGLIDDQTMMDRLLNWKYSFGAVPRIDDVATDAYMTGDWDEVESAYYRGLMSDDEFAELSKRQLAMIDRAVRST